MALMTDCILAPSSLFHPINRIIQPHQCDLAGHRVRAGRVYRPVPFTVLCYVTCFGQWELSGSDVNRGFKYACVVCIGFLLSC